MNVREYRIMYNLENIFWWHVGMRKICFALLEKFYNKNLDKLKILDAGCGTGIMLGHFADYGLPVGIDISKDALYFTHLRGYRRILCASVTDLPFANNSFDFISVLDVIYHLQVKDDSRALKEFHRVLKKESRIILRVPAYNFLKSKHDEAIHTRHRYTRDELKIKMEEAGFKVEKITYINTVLFPLMAMIRIMRRIVKSRNPPNSDVKPLSRLFNRLFIIILTIEAKLLKNIDFPFGLSIICIARKENGEMNKR